MNAILSLKPIRRPNTPARGVTLAEVAVVVGILAVLMAVATPAYFSYRGKQAVNTAQEMVDAMLGRSREEAMTAGLPLPDDLVGAGITEAAPSGMFGQGAEAHLIARLRKRDRAGQTPKTLTSRDLSQTAAIGLQTAGFGLLDLDTRTDIEGLFFEIVSQSAGATTLLASLPVELNGEFVLHQGAGSAQITFSYNSHQQTVSVTRRGVISKEN